MEAWYIDSSKEDQRLPHHLDPPQYVTNEELASKCLFYTSLLLWCFPLPDGCKILYRKFCALLFETVMENSLPSSWSCASSSFSFMGFTS